MLLLVIYPHSTTLLTPNKKRRCAMRGTPSIELSEFIRYLVGLVLGQSLMF